MGFKNSDKKYGIMAQLFHWGMFVNFVVIYSVAIQMTDLPDSDEKFALYGLHKALGVLALFLVMLRLSWKMMNPAPQTLEADESALVKKAAHLMHIVLYCLMFVVPMSGMAMSMSGGYPIRFFDLFTVPSIIDKNKDIAGIMHEVHEIAGWALLALVVGHIAAALWHGVVKKDRVLKAMLPVNSKA